LPVRFIRSRFGCADGPHECRPYESDLAAEKRAKMAKNNVTQLEGRKNHF
jgi:hypothetical protein